MFGKKTKTKLSERMKKKLLLDFNIFFDMKRKGKLNWEDIENLKSYVLTVTGWSSGGGDWSTEPFFKELWETLLSRATTKNAQHVTADEWLEAWTSVLKAKQEFDKKSSKVKPKSKPKVPSTTGISKDSNGAESPDPITEQQVVPDDSGHEQPKQEKEEEEEPGNPEDENEAEVGDSGGAPEMNVEFPEYFPEWTRKYFEYKFRLYDRSGDGWIDGEEFEYVLWDGFGVGPKECREAFKIISQDNERMIDRPYFLQLFTEYFFSDGPQSMGNQLNGTLEL